MKVFLAIIFIWAICYPFIAIGSSKEPIAAKKSISNSPIKY
jgi:hypothetical protein